MKKRHITLTNADVKNILTVLYEYEDYRNYKIKKQLRKWMRQFERELFILLNDMEELF